MGTAELLPRFNVFRSNDVGESETVLSRTLCPHILGVRSGDKVRTVQNIAKLERSELVYVRYGVPVQVLEASIEDFYLLIMPQDGNGVIRVGERRVPSVPGWAALVPAGRPFFIDTDREASSLVWRIGRQALEDCARLVTGHDIDSVIHFAPELRLDTGAASAIGRAMHFVTSELDRDEGLFQSRHALERFEQSLMLALIGLQPSNIHEEREGQRGRLAPRCVRRVEEYIHAHASDAIQLVDLIKVSGVCGRTLFRSFRRFRDMSPMEYVRRTRMRRVRQGLLQSGGGESVTSILTRWGITQYGRFAADYRRCFGELPSATLRGARSDEQMD